MSNYKLSWIKLDINILDNRKIKLIRKMPDGDTLVVLWLAILTEGMKSNFPGLIEIPPGIKVDEYFATIYEFKENTVKLGLVTFENMFNMIHMFENKIEIVGFRDHQSVDRIEYKNSLNRLKVAKSRAKSVGNNEKVTEIEKAIIDLKNNMITGVTDVTVTDVLRNPLREEKRREEKRRLDDITSDQEPYKKAFGHWLILTHKKTLDSLNQKERNIYFVDFVNEIYFKKVETIKK